MAKQEKPSQNTFLIRCKGMYINHPLNNPEDVIVKVEENYRTVSCRFLKPDGVCQALEKREINKICSYLIPIYVKQEINSKQ